MKKFLTYTLYFSLIIVLACALLAQIELSDRFIMYKTHDTDFGKIAWNINFLNKYPQQVEGKVVFLGTSMVQNGISDSLLTAKGMPSLNFGTKGIGNDLALYFLNRIVDLNPKSAVFQKRKHKPEGIHKMAALLYTPSRLLASGQSFNFHFIKFFFKRVKFSVEFLLGIVLGTIEMPDVSKYKTYGFHGNKNPMSASKYSDITSNLGADDEMFNLHLNNYMYRHEQGNSSLKQNIKIYRREFLMDTWKNMNVINNSQSQNAFLDEAYAICKRSSINFGIVYIPIIADVKEFDGYSREYYSQKENKYSTICLESFSFMDNSRFWFDYGHLTIEGAESFTGELFMQGAFKELQ